MTQFICRNCGASVYAVLRRMHGNKKIRFWRHATPTACHHAVAVTRRDRSIVFEAPPPAKAILVQ